jgi:CubicO group peptidase (beta-lactamase class C family)
MARRAPRRGVGFALLVFVLSTTTLFVQADHVDEYILAEMKSRNIPGLSLAVLRHGRVIKAKGYGVGDRKLQTAVTPETVYKIASVSKQFIATGIMLLVQDGRLKIDDPVSKYLNDAPPAWAGITVRHLLTHTAGLVREGPAFDPMKDQPDLEIIRSAYSVPLRFVPGEKYEYSNTGYYTLAEIIRVVSGRPWTAFLEDRVFKPSGMSSTWPTNTTASVPNRARGYVDNDELRDAPVWRALRPSGSFLSTVLDLAKWDAMLYTDKVLTGASRRQMWTAVMLTDGKTYPYGFGWMLGDVDGHKLVHHSGGMPGTRAMLAKFIDDGLTIVMLMNLDDVDIFPLMRGVATQYLPAR